MTVEQKDVSQVDTGATRTKPTTIDAASSLRIRLNDLISSIEDLKEAPTFLKAGKAEAALDSALRMIHELVIEVEQLQEVTHGQG